jgi:hypothetical protein
MVRSRRLLTRGLLTRGLLTRGLLTRGLLTRGLLTRGLLTRGLLPRKIPHPRVDPALACGVIALALGCLAVWVSVAPFGGRLSAIVRMAREDPISEYTLSDPGWVYGGAHYDGIYFFAMAIDPLALGRPHTLIDLGANRYGKPAYAWAAGALARFDPRAVPLTLVVVSLASLYVAALAASKVAAHLGLSPWLGLAIPLNPGLIFAVANDTSEAFGAALLCSTVWAWLSGRLAVAAALVVALCFAKEHLLLVPAGLLLWEAVRVLRAGPVGRRAVRAFFERARWLLPGPLLYAAWLVYVHSRFGTWSFSEGDNLHLPIPLAGWYESLTMAAGAAPGDLLLMQIATASVALQVAALAATLVGFAWAVRLRTPVAAIFVLVAILTCYLRWNQILFPKDLVRGVAFAFVLLPWVFGSRVPSPDEVGVSADGGRTRDEPGAREPGARSEGGEPNEPGGRSEGGEPDEPGARSEGGEKPDEPGARRERGRRDEHGSGRALGEAGASGASVDRPRASDERLGLDEPDAGPPATDKRERAGSRRSNDPAPGTATRRRAPRGRA